MMQFKRNARKAVLERVGPFGEGDERRSGLDLGDGDEHAVEDWRRVRREMLEIDFAGPSPLQRGDVNRHADRGSICALGGFASLFKQAQIDIEEIAIAMRALFEKVGRVA